MGAKPPPPLPPWKSRRVGDARSPGGPERSGGGAKRLDRVSGPGADRSARCGARSASGRHQVVSNRIPSLRPQKLPLAMRVARGAVPPADPSRRLTSNRTCVDSGASCSCSCAVSAFKRVQQVKPLQTKRSGPEAEAPGPWGGRAKPWPRLLGRRWPTRPAVLARCRLARSQVRPRG